MPQMGGTTWRGRKKMTRKVEANPKHSVGTGSISKMDLAVSEAEELLNSSTAFAAKGSAYVAVLDRRKIYAFRMHLPNTYHGYPITGSEVCQSFPEVQDKVARAMGVSVKRLARMR